MDKQTKKLRESGDLIALIAHHDTLVAINCSNTDLHKYSASILFKSLRAAHSTENEAAIELLEDSKNFVYRFGQTMRPGDTGIGYTFNHCWESKPIVLLWRTSRHRN